MHSSHHRDAESMLKSMSQTVRTTVTVPEQLARAAAEQAEQEHTSLAKVLAGWMQRGWQATQADGLLAAYDDFYAERDPEDPSADLRRSRAASFDARWA